jgi:hypothetical protein
VIADPRERGRALAAFFLETAPRLFDEIVQSDTLPESASRDLARAEWECFALYACVRGLVAAGGFNRETAAAVDAMHEAVIEAWSSQPGGAPEPRRRRVADRYAEYGAIGQEHGAAGAASLAARLGRAAARHLAPDGGAAPALEEVAGGLHESLAEGAAESVRSAT